MAIQGLGSRVQELFGSNLSPILRARGEGRADNQGFVTAGDYSHLTAHVGQAEIVNGRNHWANFRAWRTLGGQSVPGGRDFVENIGALPKEGKVNQRPWADTYWPTYQDSINHRWQSRRTGDERADFLNNLSPAEKYDVVFNGWDPFKVEGHEPYDASWGGFDKAPDQAYYDNLGPLAKAVSNNSGNRRTREAAAKGYLESDGTVNEKGKEAGVKDYGGIETWFGLCHAWVPASILEDEPLKPVTVDTPHGPITFEVSDMKALAIGCYNGSKSGFLGSRNEERPDEIKLEPNGRATKESMRDVNPGAFHVCVANRVGLQGRAFAEDRTAHYEVWNQPISEYKCETQDITKEEAMRLVMDGDGDNEYDYNPSAARFVKVNMALDYITESHASTRPNADNDGQERTDRYEYILELDNNDNIIGGEWLGSSRTHHPDFLWDPMQGGNRPISRNLTLNKVRELIKKSRADDGGEGGEGFIEPINTGTMELKAGETFKVEPIQIEKSGTLQFDLTGNGDMDVYIDKDAYSQINPDGRSPDAEKVMFDPGSNQKATFQVEAGQTIYVTMRGYEDSAANLRITQTS